MQKQLSDEIVTRAKDKLEGFEKLKSEIDTAMMEVHQKIDGVSQMIKANVRSEDNPNGLLVKPSDDYLKCLELQHRDLEVLLRQDDAYWAENFDNAKEKA